MLGYLSLDITCSLLGQISEDIFAPNGGYCLFIPCSLKYGKRTRDFWGVFIFYFSLVCYIFGAFLIKQLSHSRLEMILANPALQEAEEREPGNARRSPNARCAKICSDICSRTLSVPRSEQFPESVVRGKL